MWHEVQSDNQAYRCFRFNEKHARPVQPRATTVLRFFDYCAMCGVNDAGGIEAAVIGATVEAKVWIGDREYAAKKTLMELREEADRRGAA
jgi:hypothetical protein